MIGFGDQLAYQNIFRLRLRRSDHFFNSLQSDFAVIHKDLLFETYTGTGLPLVREKSGKSKVREKSGNFQICQGNLEFC